MTAELRLAVTGASGFCGTAVARLAAATGMSVVCLGRRPGPLGEYRPWDAARQPPDLSGVDAVVHLAAAVGDPPPSMAAEAAYRAVNVDGTARMLQAAGDRPVVFVSSASAYRPGPVGAPVREDHPRDGQRTAYGRTKAAADRLALQAGVVVLRPRAVYGDGDRHLLPRLRQLVHGGRAALPGPDVLMSLTAVQNLADACLAALAWPAGAYNVADRVPYSRDAAVSAVLGVPVRHLPLPVMRAVIGASTLSARLSGRPAAVSRYAVDQLTDGLVLDIGRAMATGWRPRHCLADLTRADLTRADLTRDDLTRDDGPDRSGWDRSGWDRSGWDRSGWDRSGWDRSGWDRSGWDRSGWDRHVG